MDMDEFLALHTRIRTPSPAPYPYRVHIHTATLVHVDEHSTTVVIFTQPVHVLVASIARSESSAWQIYDRSVFNNQAFRILRRIPKTQTVLRWFL